jgi:fatty-acyl-CoA synthase
VPLYPPLSMGRLDAYLDSTVRILEASQADLLVTNNQVQKILWSVVTRVPTLRDLVTVEKLDRSREADEPAPHIEPSDTVFLQFTSGSTALPRGVNVTHASLVANAKAIIYDGLQANRDRDVGVSWLPLYHDMGLIGFVLAPLIEAIPIVFIPTLSFVRRPGLWMDVIHKHRGSITFAPNFALARIVKRTREADLAKWDLSCLRVVGCGAEPIHAGTITAFVDKLSKACGMPRTAALPCYGMAEATLAMSFVGLDDEVTVDVIDADACYEERRARPVTPLADGSARPAGTAPLEVVSCGRTFPDHEIGVFDEHGERLDERRIGEIWFRGPSVAGGYYRNPDATRAAFGDGDGWLRTGDLGYIADGHVYISGRQKDMIIVHGRNYYPTGIEWLVEEVAGVRKGNVVVFSVPGDASEEVVVVSETNEKDPGKRDAIGAAVKQHLSEQMQLAVHDVVLIGIGQLPKTTSGKVQRRKTRQQYLDGTLGAEGVRSMGGSAEKLSLARHLAVSFLSRLRHTTNRFIRTGLSFMPFSNGSRRDQDNVN